MITRTQAERIAQSINIIRHDWPVVSLVTLITTDLAAWPILDIYVGLAHVAIERTADGTAWLSDTPARVKENGPWRLVNGIDGNHQAAKDRAAQALAERKQAIRIRQTTAAACTLCDDEGRTETGWLCRHDLDENSRSERAKARADHARSEVKPMRRIGETALEVLKQ